MTNWWMPANRKRNAVTRDIALELTACLHWLFQKTRPLQLLSKLFHQRGWQCKNRNILYAIVHIVSNTYTWKMKGKKKPTKKKWYSVIYLVGFHCAQSRWRIKKKKKNVLLCTRMRIKLYFVYIQMLTVLLPFVVNVLRIEMVNRSNVRKALQHTRYELMFKYMKEENCHMFSREILCSKMWNHSPNITIFMYAQIHTRQIYAI